MEWNRIQSIESIQEVIKQSFDTSVVIFKHSNRCSISSMALNRIRTVPENSVAYLVDVIAQKDISNAIAQHFNIEHQSPQMLIIKNGKCILENSHMGISQKSMNNAIGQL